MKTPSLQLTRLAAAKVMKVRMMPVGSTDSCFRTVSPVDSSAPSAATKPSMASLQEQGGIVEDIMREQFTVNDSKRGMLGRKT